MNPMNAGQRPSPAGEPPSSSLSFTTRQKQELPSYSSQSPSSRSSGSSAPSPVRRKPLPSTASPLAIRFSSPRLESTREEYRAEAKPLAHQRSHTLDYGEQLPPTPSEPPDFVVRDLDRYPHGHTPVVPQTREFRSLIPTVNEENEPRPPRSAHDPSRDSPPIPDYATLLPPNKNHNILSNSGGDHQSTSTSRQNGTTTMLYPSSKPRDLSLSLDVNSQSYSSHHGEPYDTNSIPKPKSPSKFSSFFGWKTSQSPGAASSSTAFSDRSTPASPMYIKPTSQGKLDLSNGAAPLIIDIPRANDSTDSAFFDGSGLPMPPTARRTSKLVGDMEEELRQITSELASSIRREMDLEDLVERLQSEPNQPPETSRRTSDYFSDSGTSSIRYPQWDDDSKQEELDRIQRKADQEKAQMRLDLTRKIQEERSDRKMLEKHIQKLEGQAPRVDQPQVVSVDSSERVRELEASLEDARRRLAEERRANSSLEDLLGALQSQIEGHQNEHAELRKKVEKLESEVTSLRSEKNALMNARNLQLEMQQQQMRINSIAEEGRGLNSQAKVGLTRSNTTARSSMIGASRSSSLSRTNSLKEREPREAPSDRVKDIEAQRDALHSALKSLLERQEYQERDYTKKIRVLEMELDRALNGTPRGSPRHRGFDRTNWRLREINDLRRRAKTGIL